MSESLQQPVGPQSAAERRLGRACLHADKVLADVPDNFAGRSNLWMVHFYDYFRNGGLRNPPELLETIEHFMNRVDEDIERSGREDGFIGVE